jgi:hypothetical protein
MLGAWTWYSLLSLDAEIMILQSLLDLHASCGTEEIFGFTREASRIQNALVQEMKRSLMDYELIELVHEL